MPARVTPCRIAPTGCRGSRNDIVYQMLERRILMPCRCGFQPERSHALLLCCCPVHAPDRCLLCSVRPSSRCPEPNNADEDADPRQLLRAWNNGPGMKPVDALDAACMRHDACTPDFGLPACGCHRQLKRDASLIAASPRQPQDIRILASLIAQGSDLMMCRDGLALGH